MFLVLQAYELLLIAGACVLARAAHALRPAALLGLIEAIFIFDPTFRLESGLQSASYVTAGLWWLLLPIKAAALAWEFKLRIPAAAMIGLLLVGAGLGLMLAGLSRPGVDSYAVLQGGAWFGAIATLLLRDLRPPIDALRNAGVVALRTVEAAFTIPLWFYFLHLWSFILFTGHAGVHALVGQVGGYFLLRALRDESPPKVWMNMGWVMAFAYPAASGFAWSAWVAAAVFAWHALAGLRFGFGTGAALAAYLGFWFLPWRFADTTWPDPPGLFSWPSLVLGLSLAAVVWWRREVLGMLVLIALCAASGYQLVLGWPFASSIQLGGLLLVAGFAALVGGVALNWWLSKKSVTSRATDTAQQEPPA